MSKDDKQLMVIDLEKAFVTWDFSELTANNILNNVDNQLKSILYSVFEAVKKNIDGRESMNFSIIMLMSAIAELYNLHKDKIKIKEYQKEKLTRNIESSKQLVKLLNAKYNIKLSGLTRYQKEMEELNNELQKVFDDKEEKELRKKLEDVENKVLALTTTLFELQSGIKNVEETLRAQEVSLSLDQFSISKDGGVFQTIESNFLNRYRNVCDLLTEFNLTPASLKFDGNGFDFNQGAKGGFSNMFGKDKKKEG